MRVALVHDWLTGMRGGERCLEAFLDLYPDADIHTLLHVPGASSERIDKRVVGHSLLESLPFARRLYRHYLPLFPLVVKTLDLRGYDLIISLSHAAAKNVVVPPGALHLCFCFTPMRYIWDQAQTYFGAMTPVLWPVLRALRSWDRHGSQGVHDFAAISNFVAARIRFFYRRRSTVIYPPCDVRWITPAQVGEKGEAFLYAGALVPYKRADLVVRAFTKLKERLWIVGTGPEEKRLRAIAGPNIEFIGSVSDADLAQYYRRARALLFPATEDFGMVPIEAMAAGRPVIGAYEGALRETVRGLYHEGELAPETATGVFMERGGLDEVASLERAVRTFMDHEGAFQVSQCVAQAQLFSPERFRASWGQFIKGAEQNAQAETAAL